MSKIGYTSGGNVLCLFSADTALGSVYQKDGAGVGESYSVNLGPRPRFVSRRAPYLDSRIGRLPLIITVSVFHKQTTYGAWV